MSASPELVDLAAEWARDLDTAALVAVVHASAAAHAITTETGATMSECLEAVASAATSEAMSRIDDLAPLIRAILADEDES